MTEKEKRRSGELALILKALGHPTRLFMVEKIMEKPRCVCELTAMVGADTSTVSKHLSILKSAGILLDTRKGNNIYYSPACDCFADLIRSLEVVIQSKCTRYTSAFSSPEA